MDDVKKSDPPATAQAPTSAAARQANVANPLGAMPSPHGRHFRALRGDISPLQAFLLGTLCIAVCGGIWWFLTRGDVAEERIVQQSVLPSPAETFGDFRSLWVDLALTRNTLMSLKRVVLGFGLAALIGIPLGISCGCFRRISAFFSPLMIVGRNIPIAAVVPLTFALFGIGEFQKVMFIFIACVAFIVMDAATAIADVSSRYVDTAYCLGASRRQIILKVLTPLAMPAIFNSLRLLFGLAFGYIMLAEVIQMAGDAGGLGSIINTAQRRGVRTYILLVLMIIPLVALGIDRLLFWVQRQLFPYQYGGGGLLHRGVRAIDRACEDFASLFRRPAKTASTEARASQAPSQDAQGGKPS
ncbi:MAG: ABC transporter permease [Thermoguttaceae bacterium]